ncbi:MAG: hypothetical protein H7236_08270 [Gemmatimonadaceae bacterium]|nr:hypothetical protein [Caulobacter sp.]
MAKVVSPDSGKVTASLAIGEKPDAAFYDAQRHLEHFSSEVVPVRVKKNASKQEIRAHGLTQSGREML